jgi:hypothetical protein
VGAKGEDMRGSRAKAYPIFFGQQYSMGRPQRKPMVRPLYIEHYPARVIGLAILHRPKLKFVRMTFGELNTHVEIKISEQNVGKPNTGGVSIRANIQIFSRCVDAHDQ